MERPALTENAHRHAIEIVVPLYHREEDTRSMFEQLDGVTDNYRLILVDNGFEDEQFLESLKPYHLIKNTCNTGAIHSVNQGLDLARGHYVCVLHSDILIFDDGWLDRIIEFMEGRPDVGLVGFGGRTAVKVDGSLVQDSTVANIAGYPTRLKPTRQWTEVVAIDGLGWVMRNIGLRLDESFGMMHFYDLDLSLQFIEGGYRVYVADVAIEHFAEDFSRSARSLDGYLKAVGGGDDAYYEEVREKFRKKWEHMLPVACCPGEALKAYETLQELRREFHKGAAYAGHLEEETKMRDAELKRASSHISRLERQLEQASDESRDRAGQLESVQEYVSGLEDQLARGAQAPPCAPGPSRLERLGFYLRTEGARPTLMRSLKKLVPHRGEGQI